MMQTDYGDRELNVQPKYYEDYLTGELQIKELAVTDTATYQCRAINRVAEALANLYLVICGAILGT